MVTPRKKPEDKQQAGRKQFDGKDLKIVIQKLEEAWALDCTDEEAALFADISKASLSDYLKRNPDIAERKEALKNKPFLMARHSVIKAFSQNPELALKYLKSKKSMEFSESVRNELTGANGSALNIKIVKE